MQFIFIRVEDRGEREGVEEIPRAFIKLVLKLDPVETQGVKEGRKPLTELQQHMQNSRYGVRLQCHKPSTHQSEHHCTRRAPKL